jgi:hypothetical protein
MKSKKGSKSISNDNKAVPGTHWNGKETTKSIVNAGNPNAFTYPKGTKK